jgi:uncharacterized protein with PIN domain
MKFIVDRNLGKLAKWLKIMGLDVIFFNRLDDGKFIKIATLEKRTIVTKNHRIKEMAREIPLIFIHKDDVDSQLEEFITTSGCNPRLKDCFSRCIICNIKLKSINKKEVEGIVPEYVLYTHEKFFFCPECKKIFWPGTHHGQMIEKLNKFFVD